MGQAVPSFRPSMRKTAFGKLQSSCQWFITMSPGRSELNPTVPLPVCYVELSVFRGVCCYLLSCAMAIFRGNIFLKFNFGKYKQSLFNNCRKCIISGLSCTSMEDFTLSISEF